jgi:hypothetical protein
MRWRMDKSSSLGMPTHPKKYPRGTSVKAWGFPRGTPSSSAKIRSPFKTLYFYCFMHYVFFLECQLFLLLVFFFFVCWNKWLDHIMFVLERAMLRFSLPRTLWFSLLSFNKCSLFLLMRLAFVFHLDFYSDLVISLHQGAFGPLFYVCFHQKSCFEKVWMVLKKTKSFMQKSGTKRSLFRLRLRLLYAMLDVILIVCLVVLL